jgi:hypothetical protein
MLHESEYKTWSFERGAYASILNIGLGQNEITQMPADAPGLAY